MTEALTRAADAVHEKHSWLSRSEANDAAKDLARAAILAFLSGEDVELLKHVRAAIIAEMYPDNFSAEACAKITLAALRALVQEEK